MRRFIGGAAALLLILLGTQIVLAQYSPSGPLTVSTITPGPGDEVAVSGDGFAAGTEVRVTLESDPVLLATVTTDQTGAFAVRVTIPSDVSGAHQLVATGLDPSGSVRALVTAITILSAPRTDTVDPTTGPLRSSDGIVLGLAGLAIVGLTLVTLYVLKRRSSAA